MNSRAKFCPSTYPSSRRRWSNWVNGVAVRGVFPETMPTRRSVDDAWARAGSGHAAAPPRTPRNSRRLMPVPWLRRQHRIGSNQPFDRGTRRGSSYRKSTNRPVLCSAGRDAHGQGDKCRKGSFTTIAHFRDVRSCSNSDHTADVPKRSLSATSRHRRPYSITSSARARSVDGMVIPSVLAVLRLMVSKYLVGACTGRSAGFSPFNMRST